MDVAALLARMAEQRAHWVDLPGGKRLQFRRPQEADMPALVTGVRIEHVVQYACGWAGFTEADLVGAAAGASDELAFHRDLWDAWVRDHTDVLPVVSRAIADAVQAHIESRRSTAKN